MTNALAWGENKMIVKTVKIDKIRPNNKQPRKEFGDIDSLAKSIKEHGLLQPVLVTPEMVIIAGERRWKAAKHAGLKEITVIVIETRSSFEDRELSFVENYHRLALSSMETEEFIYDLWKKGGPDALDKRGRKLSGRARYPTIAELAKRLNVPKSTIGSIISAHEDRKDLELSTGGQGWKDIEETAPLRDEPVKRRRVLDLRRQKKIDSSELRQFSKLVKRSEDQAEYVIELKNRGKDLETIKKKIEFVKKHEPSLQEKIIEVDLHEPSGIEEFEVELPDHDVKNFKNAMETIQNNEEIKRNTKEFKDRQKLMKNWTAHNEILDWVEDLVDPSTGDDWTKLVWKRSGLTLQESAGLARKKFEESMDD